jgi:hypothetical protein
MTFIEAAGGATAAAAWAAAAGVNQSTVAKYN